MKYGRLHKAVIASPEGISGRSNLPPRKRRRGIAASLTLLAMTGGMALAACDRHKTAYEYMPDMADAVSVKAYEGDAASPGNRSVRPPVKGTIPRGFTPYPYPESPEAAASLRNPLPRTTAILRQGQKTFQTHCQVCHGGRGLGDGPIVPKFPKPPSLVSEKVGAWTDGRIFHVITRGQNLMPSYAAQVSPEERWAAIHYVRVLQRAAHPTPEDIRRVAGKKGTDGQP